VEGFISKIQRYSTKDGPGVRSTVFAVGCPLACKWCANPELIDPGVKILYHPSRCVGCGACVALSNGAIRLVDGRCVIDRAACSNLEACAAACFYDAYEKIGTSISVEALSKKLLRDKVFYDQSGGGVTYSGGEAALQADFFLAVTGRLKPHGVHTALDTTGYAGWQKLEPLVDAVELVLYDLKALDPVIHRQYTGVDNRLILENARNIADMGKDMILRLILVPGVNDEDAEVRGRLAFAKSLGSAVRRVDLIAYHRLAAGKYASLGLPEQMADTPTCADGPAEYAAKLGADMGLPVMIEG